MSFDPAMLAQAEQVLAECRRASLMLATAESCTGGLIAACLTEIPGSSDVFERGFVTYSNAAKHDLLGVPEQLLADHGAVSGQVAQAMAAGAIKNSRAGLAIAVTGIAGPDGGSADKPVGLVWFGLARCGQAATAKKRYFEAPGRNAIRLATVCTALELLRAHVQPLMAS